MRVTAIRLGVGFAATLLATSTAIVLAGPVDAEPVPTTFSATGGSQAYTVPANVCQVTIDAFGGQGGDGGSNGVFGTGGLGARRRRPRSP